MGRPVKEGLDYFPVDIDMDDDDKIELIEAKHGIVGFGIVVKLLMRIFRNGYFYQWTEKEQLLFSKRVGMPIDTVTAIVGDAAHWNFFDPGMLKKHSILTSKGIQKRYLLATKRRQQVEIIKDYLLLSRICLNEHNNLIIVDINGENVSNGTQSKVKESKGEESKEKYAPYVHMFKHEYQKLIDNYGEASTRRMIEILDNYKGAKGKTYKDDYRAILSWVVDSYTEKHGIAPARHGGGLKTECPVCREKVAAKDITAYEGYACCKKCAEEGFNVKQAVY